jgi:hypothetical protein
MDVEGHEHRVLLGAREFFKRIDVHGIVMEWAWHVKRPSANIIKSIMKEFKFKPQSITQSINHQSTNKHINILANKRSIRTLSLNI